MNSMESIGAGLKPFWRMFFALCLCVAWGGLGRASEARTGLVLWDTCAKPGSEFNPQERDAWKMVPDDLLTLEANPAKARSDPGYYGREYSFKGDAVVENEKLMAAFSAARGRVVLYSKTASGLTNEQSSAVGPICAKVLELGLSQLKPEGSAPGHVEILRNVEDEVVLRFWFQSAPEVSAVLSFGKREIIDVKPSAEMKGARVAGAFEYGIVPSFIGDDLVFGSEKAGSNATLCLLSENMLLGLLKGESSQLVMTWPKGKQQVRLGLGEAQEGRRAIESIDFDNAGERFYLAVLSAPGIWHREKLNASFLEQDVTIDWKRPFPARWKTQLYEESLKTTFAFRNSQGEIWRGVPGSYNYPVWFDGDKALYRLGKKVPPKGESVIYCVEGQGTPTSIFTPVDVLKSTLGRSTADSILDVEGRKLRTHHRRGGDGVHRACTCGCTEAIQAVFEAGEEVSRKDDIKGDLEDMLYFVHRHVDRINEYQRFANGLMKELDAKKAAVPELAEYVESLEDILKQIPEEYSVQMENMKSFEYADDLVKRTIALSDKHDPDNLKSYMELLKQWRAMGGAQDYVLARCHIIVRNFAQEAGYGCADKPQAVALAEELRARARQCLRNPDGYEIWADY
jgi:hypothetical protein